MRRRFLTVVAPLWLAAPAAAQPVAAFDALRASAEITDRLARGDLGGAAEAASRLMDATSTDRVRSAFQLAGRLGHGQYADLVYARDLGRTGKDVIHKINFERGFLFVRYLFNVNNGAWRLTQVQLEVENEQPFPRGWVHIYPP